MPPLSDRAARPALCEKCALFAEAVSGRNERGRIRSLRPCASRPFCNTLLDLCEYHPRGTDRIKKNAYLIRLGEAAATRLAICVTALHPCHRCRVKSTTGGSRGPRREPALAGRGRLDGDTSSRSSCPGRSPDRRSSATLLDERLVALPDERTIGYPTLVARNEGGRRDAVRSRFDRKA